MSEQKKSFATICFMGLILALYAILLLKPFVPSVRMAFMKEMHLNDSSFFHWSALHLLPAMYSFSNEAIYSPDYIVEDDLEEDSVARPEMWRRHYNHYPLRIVTFARNRHGYIAKVQSQRMVLFSKYRGDELATPFKLEPDGDHLIIKRK